MSRKLDELSWNIDDKEKTVEAEIFQVIEPEEQNNYFWGKYANTVIEDYRVLHATTNELDPSSWWNKLVKWIPFVSGEKEQFVMLADKDEFYELRNKDEGVFKIRPSFYGTSYPFTILEEVVEVYR